MVMSERPGFSIAAQEPIDGKSGAAAAFPYRRVTVERFRSVFPGARWGDDLRAWFVPGTTAERRLNRWLGREMSGVLTYADDRGRDGFAFQPIESRYLEVADDLRIRSSVAVQFDAQTEARPRQHLLPARFQPCVRVCVVVQTTAVGFQACQRSRA
jgi:hypothetical protein